MLCKKYLYIAIRPWNGLDIEFHMRFINYQYESLRIKKMRHFI